MIVLGLDPGTRHFGWGVVARSRSRLVHVAHGVIHTRTEDPLAARLVAIESALVAVIGTYRPEVVGVESLFFHKDAQAAAKLGHARGVALLAAARAGLDVAEYAPALVKRSVAGAGRADKSQVADMVRVLLGLSKAAPVDASDALAVALTHLQKAALLRPVTPSTPSAIPLSWRPTRRRHHVSRRSSV